jgi:hypothetical protein
MTLYTRAVAAFRVAHNVDARALGIVRNCGLACEIVLREESTTRDTADDPFDTTGGAVPHQDVGVQTDPSPTPARATHSVHGELADLREDIKAIRKAARLGESREVKLKREQNEFEERLKAAEEALSKERRRRQDAVAEVKDHRTPNAALRTFYEAARRAHPASRVGSKDVESRLDREASDVQASVNGGVSHVGRFLTRRA